MVASHWSKSILVLQDGDVWDVTQCHQKRCDCSSCESCNVIDEPLHRCPQQELTCVGWYLEMAENSENPCCPTYECSCTFCKNQGMKIGQDKINIEYLGNIKLPGSKLFIVINRLLRLRVNLQLSTTFNIKLFLFQANDFNSYSNWHSV